MTTDLDQYQMTNTQSWLGAERPSSELRSQEETQVQTQYDQVTSMEDPSFNLFHVFLSLYSSCPKVKCVSLYFFLISSPYSKYKHHLHLKNLLHNNCFHRAMRERRLAKTSTVQIIQLLIRITILKLELLIVRL